MGGALWVCSHYRRGSGRGSVGVFSFTHSVPPSLEGRPRLDHLTTHHPLCCLCASGTVGSSWLTFLLTAGPWPSCRKTQPHPRCHLLFLAPLYVPAPHPHCPASGPDSHLIVCCICDSRSQAPRGPGLSVWRRLSLRIWSAGEQVIQAWSFLKRTNKASTVIFIFKTRRDKVSSLLYHL